MGTRSQGPSGVPLGTLVSRGYRTPQWPSVDKTLMQSRSGTKPEAGSRAQRRAEGTLDGTGKKEVISAAEATQLIADMETVEFMWTFSCFCVNISVYLNSSFPPPPHFQAVET